MSEAKVRGCGVRVQGGVYAESPLASEGLPLEAFIIDPPLVVDMAALGLTPLGVKLVEEIRPEGSVWHILDFVGSDSYPNTADFAEEVRHLGASRRLPRPLDFSRLTKDSRLVLVHARAFIVNSTAYYMQSGWGCPKDLETHSAANGGRLNAIPSGMCAGLWWEDVDPGRADSFDTNGGRAVRRQMPSFSYEARMAPPGMTRAYRPAVFMRLPIRNLAVIRAEDGSHEASVAAASASELPVHLEES